MTQLFNHAIKSDVGLVRKANEDSAGFAPSSELRGNGDLFVVCDGMGGHIGGAIASSTAVNCIIDFFRNKFYENPYVAINDAIIFTNEQIYARSCAESELKGMGTTCCVLLIRNSEAFIGHVGDSRIYFHASGKIHRVTRDHSFVQNLVEQGLISDAEAESHPRKNEILRALGIKADVQPEISSHPIHPKKGDKFLMCSDGLSGLVHDDVIEKILSSNSDLESKTTELVALANEGGGFDNITVAIVEIVQSPFNKSVFIDYSPINRNEATGQINSMAATQEISHEQKTKKARWKQPKYLLVGGVLAIALIAYIVWPSGKGNTTTELSPADSTKINIGAQDENVKCEYNYSCVINATPTVPYTMKGAIDQIKTKANADGLYYSDCLEFRGSKLGNLSGEEVLTISETDSKKVQPKDSLWLDCACIKEKKLNGVSNSDNSNSGSNTGTDNRSIPTDTAKASPISKDTSGSNNTDSGTNQSPI